MNIIEYVIRKLSGLPTREPTVVTRTRTRLPYSRRRASDMSRVDLFLRQTDHTMYGAITPVPREDDLISSKELHERVQAISKACGQPN